ncbi:hypothetical protein HAX54_050228 [Datura stramonium]|uniref:Uncharacterized protein n=1 Tax=Datura stramonium TaxID=4076 RepID=A0ABS8WL48_DATST|nr:hypothetical protein [Datura stramonium]
MDSDGKNSPQENIDSKGAFRLICKSIRCSMKFYRLSELQLEVDSLKALPALISPPFSAQGDAAVKELVLVLYLCLTYSVCFIKALPLYLLDSSVREAFDVAYDNIYAFHAAQKPVEKVVENMHLYFATPPSRDGSICKGSVFIVPRKRRTYILKAEAPGNFCNGLGTGIMPKGEAREKKSSNIGVMGVKQMANTLASLCLHR